VKQAAAERINCADFDPVVAAGHRSSASTSTSASASAAAAAAVAADEIDRLNRSVRQHVEKIRCGRWLQHSPCARVIAVCAEHSKWISRNQIKKLQC
jgi:hypothetical protein